MKEPKIRFKGFKGEWVETPLLDVVTLYNGLTYTPNDIRDHGTLVLRSSNVQEGEISLFDNVYVRSEVATSPNVKKGDIIVVVRNGSRTLIGKHAQIKSDMPNTVIGAFMAGIHTDEPEFLNALLCTRRFDNEVTINLGATINQITNGTFHSMKFLFPDKKEQKALGYYFQHLDSLIQSTTKKIESLKQVKAASLQSMFPQEGETTPRVRFKGFDGKWVALKYDEVFSLIGDSGHNVQKTGYCERGLYPIIDQSKQYIVGYTDKVLPLDGTNGFIIFGDHTREFKYIDFPFCTGADGIRILKCEKNFDSRFIYYNCSSLYIPNTGYNRHFKYIKEATYLTPKTMEEQRAIASYFTNLDRQITLQTQRLEKLKQIKSACLDNMFV